MVQTKMTRKTGVAVATCEREPTSQVQPWMSTLSSSTPTRVCDLGVCAVFSLTCKPARSGYRQTYKVRVICHATPTTSMVLHAAALLRFIIKEKSLYVMVSTESWEVDSINEYSVRLPVVRVRHIRERTQRTFLPPVQPLPPPMHVNRANEGAEQAIQGRHPWLHRWNVCDTLRPAIRDHSHLRAIDETRHRVPVPRS
ncbi:hypothetical protein EDB84DRAFT_1535477 [Lactarius hengduanensis]|nr:hypothetical protein EDB84DRAFT_1535477 [Lactarius hengduanensis]